MAICDSFNLVLPFLLGVRSAVCLFTQHNLIRMKSASKWRNGEILLIVQDIFLNCDMVVPPMWMKCAWIVDRIWLHNTIIGWQATKRRRSVHVEWSAFYNIVALAVDWQLQSTVLASEQQHFTISATNSISGVHASSIRALIQHAAFELQCC